MKVSTTILIATGIALLLFTGCNSTPKVTQNAQYDIHKLHIVEYSKDVEEGEERYYYKPEYSWSYRLDASNAYINTITSSSILTCQENDIWFISLDEREEQSKVRNTYLITLAKFQLDDMKDDPTYIPRRDSEEFLKLIEIDTRLAQHGLTGCVSQMSKEEVEKVIPHTKRK